MARKRTNHLVCEYLEKIDRKMLVKYQDLIREFIKGHQGIYALYRGDRLYYVGLATNLRRRLKAHLRDRHKNAWNRFSVYLVIENQHIKELESLFLRILMPDGNAKKGTFPKAINLETRLKTEIRRRQQEELEVLLGQRKRVTRKQTKRALAQQAESETALGPYVSRSFKIRRTFKGKPYVARVRQSGWIYYKGYLYNSPSGLAKEITGRNSNGWSFWNFERAPGHWVKLKELKR